MDESAHKAHEQGENRAAGSQLVRSSFVPLYYQLQEILKEQIESGIWRPGDALPAEPKLAHRYQVSRVVVRQALAILEDDHQIVRVRGRGTFVSEPKVQMQAGGLSRLLATPRDPGTNILVLDKSHPTVEQSIRSKIGADHDEDILRITTLRTAGDKPLAITYSFFRAADATWLDQTTHTGRNISPEFTLARFNLELSTSSVSIETSHCGQFEADRFGIPARSGVFLIHAIEYTPTPHGHRPLEFARAEYRGDKVQFQVSTGPDTGP